MRPENDNPWFRVGTYDEHRRERFLTPDDLKKLDADSTTNESLCIRTSPVEALNPSVCTPFCESTGAGGMRPVRKKALLLRKELCQGRLGPNSSILTGGKVPPLLMMGNLGHALRSHDA